MLHMSHFRRFFFYKLVQLVGGGSVINGALSPIDNTPSSLYLFQSLY